jgi:hypothetical protein
LAGRKLELVIPARLWEKLNEFEQRTGIKKEDLFTRTLINLIEGFRCSHCGSVIREFE